jgi:hypothetical protein
MLSCLIGLLSFQLASAGSWCEEFLTMETERRKKKLMHDFISTIMYPAWEGKYLKIKRT